jgi:hypothetical protein
VAPIARHHDRFLAEIAALGVTDRTRAAVDLDDKAVLIEIDTETGRARLDTE